jgi:predicted GIY-YIG superfamily endonuclease
MSKSNLQLANYENSLKTLISLLQTQILTIASLHGIDKTWSFQFSSIYSQMKSFEDHHRLSQNYSTQCKELFIYINRNLTSQQSTRSRAISLESSMKRRQRKPESQKNSIIFPQNPHRKAPSSYYSNIMSKFLSANGIGTNIGGTKVKEDQDIWVLGDDLKFLP